MRSRNCQPPHEFLERWELSLATYLPRQFDDAIAEDDDFDPEIHFLETLHEMLDWCIADCGIRDEWKHFSMPMVYGQQAMKKSAKLHAEFALGIGQNEFYLECPISAPEYLHQMGDQFWSELLKLSRVGDLKYEPDSLAAGNKFDPKGKLYFRKHASAVFGLIRNFLILKEGETDSRDFHLGHLQVAWPVSMPLLETICKVRDAMRHGYTLNSHLYRARYITLHRNLKKTWSELNDAAKAYHGSFRNFLHYVLNAQ